MLTVADLRAEHFKPCIGQAFTIELDGGEVCEAVLESVTEGAKYIPEAVRAPFNLIFQTTRKPEPMQGTYVLAHPELGRFELFMNATFPTAKGQVYQCMFS